MDTRQGLIGDQELETAMASLPADRVTRKAIDARISQVDDGDVITRTVGDPDNPMAVSKAYKRPIEVRGLIAEDEG